MEYLVVIERGATSFGAYVPDLPGCVEPAPADAAAGNVVSLVPFRCPRV